jgi:hypothetical protein
VRVFVFVCISVGVRVCVCVGARRRELHPVPSAHSAVAASGQVGAESGGRVPWSLAAHEDKLALVQDLRKAFDKLDRNGDGELSEVELATAFVSMGVPAEAASQRVRRGEGVGCVCAGGCRWGFPRLAFCWHTFWLPERSSPHHARV